MEGKVIFVTDSSTAEVMKRVLFERTFRECLAEDIEDEGIPVPATPEYIDMRPKNRGPQPRRKHPVPR